MSERDAQIRTALAPYGLSTLDEARRVMPPHQYLAIERQVGAAQPGAGSDGTAVDAARGRATLSARLSPVTLLLLVSLGIVFVAECAQPGGSESIATLRRLGALTPDTWRSGQAWRLVASSFLHIGILHIGGNAIALFWVGRLAERLFGPLRYLAIYLAAGLGGALLTALLVSNAVTVGASGAIWGLMAALLVGSWRNKDVAGRVSAKEVRQSIIAFVIANAIFSFSAGVSISGHAGGCLVGALLGALVPFAGGVEGRTRALARDAAAWAIIAATAGLMLTAAF